MVIISEQAGGSKSIVVYKIGANNLISSSENCNGSHGENSKNIQWTIFERISTFFRQIFLPAGYPDSVSKDYSAVRTWELTQTFAHLLTVTIATERVMRAAGVGNALASPVSAATLVLLKNGIGALGGIVFTWKSGGEFYKGTKKWRMAADILCDLSILTEMLTPLFSFRIMLLLTSLTSLFRFTCGFLGESTRAVVHKHHSIRNNFEDVLTKHIIQTKLIVLLGLLCSVYLLHILEGDDESSWAFYIFLTWLHLYANYRGLKSLQLKTLNKETMLTALKQFLENETIPSIQNLNQGESVFMGFGRTDVSVCGYHINIGSSFASLVNSTTSRNSTIKDTLEAFQDQPFAIILSITSKKVNILLRKDIKPEQIMEAYARAVIGAALHGSDVNNVPDFLGAEVNQRWNQFRKLIEAWGIRTDESSIEVGAVRVDWKLNRSTTKFLKTV